MGTTENLVRPILERSGLQAGEDFLLAYSPERVLPGQIMVELVQNARVVGGVTPASAEAGRNFYSRFVGGEIVLTDATTAEMIKLMENTFRDVNVALANEFALIAESMGVDVWKAIEMANRHPRVNILRPSPGVGGHCVAVDPWFLVEAAPEQARLIRQARLVNDAMPDHVVDLACQAVEGLTQPAIACLGLSYKANVGDTRESPAISVVERLVHLGYMTRAFDPHAQCPDFLVPHVVDAFERCVAGADLLILLVDHDEFRGLTPADLAGMRRRKVLDTRCCLDASLWKGIDSQLIRLGSPSHLPRRS
jgi:UDP-N-acetyl-D-mannosaminuronic acid dehydrogenase